MLDADSMSIKLPKKSLFSQKQNTSKEQATKECDQHMAEFIAGDCSQGFLDTLPWDKSFF
jgi:hypothetical protein